MLPDNNLSIANNGLRFKYEDLIKECKAKDIKNNIEVYGEYIEKKDYHYLKNSEGVLIEVKYKTIECFTGIYANEAYENRVFINENWVNIPEECWLGIPLFKKLEDIKLNKGKK